MGREIRRVPPNWEHPRNERGEFRAMYDRTYAEAVAEWTAGYAKWEAGERKSDCEFWEWEGNPPDPDYYRPEFTEEPTWFQVYQTVSEGTPVTPPFATEDELIDYLVENGDFWCQERPNESPPSRESATAFVKSGWVPSGLVHGGRVTTGIDVAGVLK